MNRKFIENNGRVDVVDMHEGFLKDEFSAGVYSVRQDIGGFFIQKDMSKFDMPDRVYGNAPIRADKVKNTFDSREATTGVLLTGLKGSGKTFFIKYLANKCIDDGIPVVMINDPFSGNDFLSFLNSLGSCVFIFDEFAKTYRRGGGEGGQESLLTLFDGVATGKRLIMLSENDYWDVSSLYKNRPSRIYYAYKYEKLERAMVEEYCGANLAKKEFMSDVIKMSNQTLEFSFDVLQSVVEECNRYPDLPFDDIAGDLNISMSEGKTKLVIEKIIAIEGAHKGISFTPDVKIAPFDDFSTNIRATADEVLDGDEERPQIIYMDIDMDSFQELIGDTYVFIQGNYELHGKTISSVFSMARGLEGKRNSMAHRYNTNRDDTYDEPFDDLTAHTSSAPALKAVREH